MRTPLFIGIDPGTTTGYAVLDREKRPLAIGSGKEMGLSFLLKKAYSFGIPVVVGTDKAHVPQLISQFSAKTGCRIIAPTKDLLTEEKRRLARDFQYNNTHELDAVASAVFGHGQCTLLPRISSIVPRQILDQAIVYTIRDRMPLKHTLILLEKKDEKIGEKKALPISQIPSSHPEAITLKHFKELSRLREENLLLRKAYHTCQSRIRALQAENESLLKKAEKGKQLTRKKLKSHLSMKERQILRLLSALEESERRYSRLAEEHTMLEGALKEEGLVVLESVETLGKDIDANISLPRIFVKNPHSHSSKTIQALNGKILLIICHGDIPRDLKIEGAMILSDKEISVRILGKYCLVRGDDINEARKKKFNLHQIIKEYKEGRQ